MSITTITELYVFILAGFLGYQLVTRVPPLLHTPLMSATNAICGISLVGALVEAGAHHSVLSTVLGTVAVASAAVNVVGGFLMTDRMLRMFKRRPAPAIGGAGSGGSVSSAAQSGALTSGAAAVVSATPAAKAASPKPASDAGRA